MFRTIGTLTVVVAALAFSPGCGDKETSDGGSSAKASASGGGGGGSSAKAKALEEAWNKDANCKVLDACCKEMVGTNWESTLKPFCGQMAKLKDFGEQAKNSVDAAWQSRSCQQRVTALKSMGNASNKLPAGCYAK